MMFIAIKTEDGVIKGKLSFYCRMLKVTRREFYYKYLANKDRPWKYQDLADAIRKIASEDECNDTYGRIRMYQALLLKQPEGVHIPGKRTIYRIMKEIGLSHHPKRKPNGITKADREARKSDDMLKRNFTSANPLKKYVTDITEIEAKVGNYAALHACICITAGEKNIGDGLYVSTGACILGSVKLGNYVTVGANAVVSKSEGDNVLLVGIPDVNKTEELAWHSGNYQKRYEVCEKLKNKVFNGN